MKLWLSILMIFILCGFSKRPVEVPKQPTIPEVVATPLPPVAIEPTPNVDVKLYWENTTEPHPERKPWTDLTVANIKRDLAVYEKAEDITKICPKFKTLTETQKIKAIGEFWVATAYYESSFNPKSNSVDVGSKGDKESWSVGLYQMSGNDSSTKKFGANFEKLKDPLVNINVAHEQMMKQIRNCKKIILPNHSSCRYWAVLLTQNRYSKVDEILGRVKKQAPFCY